MANDQPRASTKTSRRELDSHDTEDLDLLDLSDVSNLLPDLTDVKRVVVSSGFSLGVDLGGILPSLRERSARSKVELRVLQRQSLGRTNLGESTCEDRKVGVRELEFDGLMCIQLRRELTVIPDVSVVREAVSDEPQLALQTQKTEGRGRVRRRKPREMG